MQPLAIIDGGSCCPMALVRKVRTANGTFMHQMNFIVRLKRFFTMTFFSSKPRLFLIFYPFLFLRAQSSRRDILVSSNNELLQNYRIYIFIYNLFICASKCLNRWFVK